MGFARRNIRYPRGAAQTSYLPGTVGIGLYDMPVGIDGPTPTIGIIELGGGWVPTRLASAFAKFNLPLPEVVDVSVNGGRNQPGTDADDEVMLDLQLAAAECSALTRKPAKIRMYWANNTDADFVAAVVQAVKDGCWLISISWGAPESQWPATAKIAMTNAFRDGEAVGTYIVVASGDNLSNDGVNDGQTHVDFPSSSPFAFGAGGTTRIGNKESVWNSNGGGTGGGFSADYPSQTWQIGAPANQGRSVPDFAANADPNTGYKILSNDGNWGVIGGTSAVAPAWAGWLAAMFSGCGGRMIGFRQWLYNHPALLTDIIDGDNGQWKAKAGLDQCTGLGVPSGKALYAGLLKAVGTTPPPPPPTPIPPPAPVPVPTTVTIVVPQQPVYSGPYLIGRVPPFTVTGKVNGTGAGHAEGVAENLEAIERDFRDLSGQAAPTEALTMDSGGLPDVGVPAAPIGFLRP